MNALAPFEFETRWVAWRNEERNGKLTKVPYSPHNGREAKADDPRTWNTRSAAEARAKNIVGDKGGGIGIELGDLGDGYSLGGIDLDTCRSSDGTLEPWAAEVIRRLKSYTEISPSKTGVKIVFRYLTADYEKLRPALGSAKYSKMFNRGNGKDHPPAIEVHLNHRYFAITEEQLDGVPDEIVVVDAADLLWLLTDYGPAFAKSGKDTATPGKARTGTTNGHDGSRSGAAFRLAREMQRAGVTYEQFVEAARINPDTASWCREKGEVNGQRELRRAWDNAQPAATGKPSDGVTLDDFHAYLPMHCYIYTPTRAMWPATSVNSQIPPVPLVNKDGTPKLDDKGKPVSLAPAQWIDRNQPVHQMTWAPGLPEIIEDRLMYDGGWIERPGVRMFNQYLAPSIIPDDAARADRWLKHLEFVYPDTAEHMLNWFAHRVQRPWEKINHAIVMGGSQGIGKDTILEPLKQAVGPWNFKSENPVRILGDLIAF